MQHILYSLKLCDRENRIECRLIDTVTKVHNGGKDGDPLSSVLNYWLFKFVGVRVSMKILRVWSEKRTHSHYLYEDNS